MTDIVIGHCALNIRRPSDSAVPWLGDDDHKALATRVQSIVLPMLEEILAPLLPDTDDEIDDLTIAINLNTRDLIGAAPLARPALRARLASAIETSIDRLLSHGRDASVRTRDAARADASAQLQPHHRQKAGGRDHAARRIRRLLQHFFGRETKQLAITLISDRALVNLFIETLIVFGDRSSASGTAQSLQAIRHLSAQATLGPGDRQQLITELSALTRTLDDKRSGSGGDDVSPSNRAEILRRAGLLLTRIQDPSLVGDRLVTDQLPRVQRGVPDVTPGDTPRQSAVSAMAEPTTKPVTTAGNNAGSPVSELGPGRYDLEHALPFLACAMLSRHQIGDALALDFDRPEVASGLAAAISLKCLLTDAKRGPGAWPESARRAAALTAGRQDKPDGELFARTSGATTGNGVFARAAVAAALTSTLQPSATLPLVPTGTGFVLFDTGGFFPVACGSVEDLLPMMRALNRTYFLASAEATHWAFLHAAGLPAMAEGSAIKGEEAIAIAGPNGWRGYATDVVKLSVGLAAALPAEAARAQRAGEIWKSLAHNARLTAMDHPPTPLASFDELAALLAGFALAEIGWALGQHDAVHWADPDPLMVRDRFFDLGGHLDVTPDLLTIHLPLGRRFLDLRDAGLLNTVPALPSWSGRPIAFTGG